MVKITGPKIPEPTAMPAAETTTPTKATKATKATAGAAKLKDTLDVGQKKTLDPKIEEWMQKSALGREKALDSLRNKIGIDPNKFNQPIHDNFNGPAGVHSNHSWDKKTSVEFGGEVMKDKVNLQQNVVAQTAKKLR